jgi:two-component system chemotaxis response regulator CheY
MKGKILVVDDAAFMRMMIKDILTKEGYEIAGEAATGREAVEKFSQLKPDVVTMDITMPEMNGIEALKQILNYNSNAKVVMVSAMGQDKLIIEALEAGAVDFIVKPFQPKKVVETVAKCLSSNNKET